MPGLSSYTGNVRAHDWNGSHELLEFECGETGPLELGYRFAIRFAAISDAPPKRFRKGLYPPLPGPTPGGDVFNEEQLSSRFEHAKDLVERALLVHNAKEHEGADDEIRAGILGGQILRRSVAQFHFEP